MEASLGGDISICDADGLHQVGGQPEGRDGVSPARERRGRIGRSRRAASAATYAGLRPAVQVVASCGLENLVLGWLGGIWIFVVLIKKYP